MDPPSDAKGGSRGPPTVVVTGVPLAMQGGAGHVVQGLPMQAVADTGPPPEEPWRRAQEAEREALMARPAGSGLQRACADYRRARTIREMLEARHIFQGFASRQQHDDREHSAAGSSGLHRDPRIGEAIARLGRARNFREMAECRQKLMELCTHAARAEADRAMQQVGAAEQTAMAVERRCLQRAVLHEWYEIALKAQNERLAARIAASSCPPTPRSRGAELTLELDAVGGAVSAAALQASFEGALACRLPQATVLVGGVALGPPPRIDFRLNDAQLDSALGALRRWLREDAVLGAGVGRSARPRKLLLSLPGSHGGCGVPLEDFAAEARGVAPEEPSEGSGEEDEEDPRRRPEYWGLRVGDLAEFYTSIRSDLEEYCRSHWLRFSSGGPVHVCRRGAACAFGDHCGVPHEAGPGRGAEEGLRDLAPNMHTVVARYVKPMTKESGSSFALMKYPQGNKITHFITHTWEENFEDFVWTLQTALSQDDVVWVCSFALNQNADIEQAISGELIDCPFAVALRHAVKQLVVLDEHLVVPRRSWCAYELAIAGQFSIPTFLWPHRHCDTDRLSREVDGLDMREATATKLEDQTRIREAIEAGSGGGFDKLNHRLQDTLHLTLRFHKEAAAQVAELSRLVEVARGQGKATELEALRKSRAEELRRLEAAEASRQRERLLEERCVQLEAEARHLRRRLADAERRARGARPSSPDPHRLRRQASPVRMGCSWFRRRPSYPLD